MFITKLFIMLKCKFEKQGEYYSDDNGISWLSTGECRKGALIESASTDCTTEKFKLTYTDSSEYAVSCNSSSTITQNETSMGPYDYRYIVSAEIGDCVTTIGYGAFAACFDLTSVTLSDSVATIGEAAFGACSGLTSFLIPDSVTSIEDEAFNYCLIMVYFVCLASTPPALGNQAFDNTNDSPIYVPSASVNAYKTASGWSNYANRIYPLPNS